MSGARAARRRAVLATVCYLPGGAVLAALASGEGARRMPSDSSFASLVAAAADPIVVLDAEARVVYANPAALALWGDAGGGEPVRFVERVEPSERARVAERLRGALEGQDAAAPLECRIVGADGRERWTCWRTIALERGAPSARVGLVGRASADDPDARERTECALAALGELADASALLAHEIRTPITAAHLALRVAGDRLGLGEAEVIGDLVVRFQRVEQMARQLGALAQPLAFSLAPVSAAAVLHRVAETLAPDTAARGVRVQAAPVDDALELRADSAALQEALVGLARRMAHDLAAGGSVELSARALADPRAIELALDDDGPAPEPAEPTAPTDPIASRRWRGMRLALAVARRVAAGHGGVLHCGRSVRGGASCALRLPASHDS